MEFDLSKIKLSRKDVKRGLKFPLEMNEKLAEDIGIMIGDGCISINKYNNLNHHFISVDGNSLNDRDYLLKFVKNLKFELYNLNFNSDFKKNRNEMRITVVRTEINSNQNTHLIFSWKFNKTKDFGLESNQNPNTNPKLATISH